MTSVLPKKHQITRSNTRRWTPAKWTGVAASFVLLLASTASGIQGQEQSAAEPQQESQYSTPLERLKARSPQERWEQLNRAEHDPTLMQPVEPATSQEFPLEDEAAIGVLKPLSRPNRRSRIGRDNFIPNGENSPPAIDAQQYLPLPGTQADGRDSWQWRNAAPTPVHDPTIDSSLNQDDQLGVPDHPGENVDDLEMSREFPNPTATDNADFGYYTSDQPSVQENDPIYQDIEEEFPRIHVSVPPEAEFMQPLQQPVIPNTVAPAVIPNTVPPATVAQFEDQVQVEDTVPPDDWDQTKELIASPKDIKPLSDIQPYFDYEPDPQLQKTDPYRNVFPRPDGQVEQDLKQFPEVVDLGEDLYQQRDFAHVDYNWVATDFWHYPLYFQDAAYERNGHTYAWWFQPFASFGTFGLQFFGLPYQMSIHPICEKEYVLGWYRPGEYVPYLWYQVPWNTDAAVRTGMFYTGMMYAFP